MNDSVADGPKSAGTDCSPFSGTDVKTSGEGPIVISESGRRPTVLHVMTRMSTGGTERQLVGMLKAAHGRLWDAHLCVLYPGYPLAAEAAEFMPVTELPYTTATDPRRPLALRRLAREVGADVVHPSLWGAGWVTRMSLGGPRRPALVMSERSVEDFRSPWQRRLDTLLRPITDAWIGNSRDVVDFIQRAHGAPAGRVVCVGNGIDSEVFHPTPGRRRPGGPRIGGVGRLVPGKNWDVAIAAMARVLRVRPDATLTIAGDGPCRDSLREAANGLPVGLTGLLRTPTEVAAFLRDLDVFILPSSYEGLPNVVLEAQACGVPVVVTDVPGTAEAVGATARRVPPGDPSALADAVVAVLDGARTGDPVRPQTFADVAAGHLAVFEAARLRRAAS